ncbi:MAG: hypothetical protein ABSB15_26580 [Bryobacteraceae bacterium]
MPASPIRCAILLFALAAAAPAWVESVEFPWNTYPRPLWERELVWIKNIGIAHVSLPPARDASEEAQLADLIRVIRRLNLEADLEGPIPDSMQPLARAHGGPLTDPLPIASRISALAPDALTRSRKLLTAGNPGLLWTDVEDTVSGVTNGTTSGYHAGAVNFAGQETPATIPLRRNALLSRYWGNTMASLHETKLPASPPIPQISIHQFAGKNGTSFVSVVNASSKPWTGAVKAVHPVLKRVVDLPGVSVPAHDTLWLPVNVPLLASPLCKDCTAFSTVDRLVYATAEITAMEYENGILAMEFSAPAAGEVVLQLSSEPSGPLVAGGKPASFDWDEHTLRARLPIPKGAGPGGHTRIGLAIDAPDATAFFESADVLLIGETNRLTAEFSSQAILQRSRLRTAPELSVTDEPAKEDASAEGPRQVVYRIKVPETAIHGDHADLAIEADGAPMSHARPQLLHPATVRFADAITVRVAANSRLPLFPATLPVNRRTGRDVTIFIDNNAPEIRNFTLELKAEGLDFSPSKMDVTVGASMARDVSFRVFATGASAGLHDGEARLSGAASAIEAVRFLVIPQNGAVAFSSGGLSLLESAKERAAFLPGRWLEFIDKDSGQDLIAIGGTAFNPGPIDTRSDALVFAGEKIVRLPDLEQLLPKPKR